MYIILYCKMILVYSYSVHTIAVEMMMMMMMQVSGPSGPILLGNNVHRDGGRNQSVILSYSLCVCVCV